MRLKSVFDKSSGAFCVLSDFRTAIGHFGSVETPNHTDCLTLSTTVEPSVCMCVCGKIQNVDVECESCIREILFSIIVRSSTFLSIPFSEFRVRSWCVLAVTMYKSKYALENGKCLQAKVPIGGWPVER